MKKNKKENILVIIAARGGSKGIKNKNIKSLNGRPLMVYTILQAKKWGMAEDIVCSTDSKKIATVARAYGAEVPFKRPKHLAGDATPKLKVIRHAFMMCEKIYNKKYDIIVDLDVTSPIRKNNDLNNCLNLFRRKRPKTLFSVVTSRKNPYFNMVEKRGNTYVLSKKLRKTLYARQSAPIVYDMNASIYFYNRNYLIDAKNTEIITNKSMIYVMDEVSGVDVDTVSDLMYLEFLIREGVWKSEV